MQSKYFGLIFVTDDLYEQVRSSTSQKAEEYVYAYRLGENVTNDDLKEKIKEIELDYDKVEDEYFRETIDEALSDREDLEDGVNELYDGSSELSDGMKELTDHSTGNSGQLFRAGKLRAAHDTCVGDAHRG